MFKLFNRQQQEDTPPQPEFEPRPIRSPIAEVEFMGTTAVATLTVTDLSSAGSADKLADLLDELADTGATSFVLDTQNVQTVDSACLGCLVHACNRLAARGGRIALANAANTVQQVVKLTKLDRVFPICSDVMSALTEVERRHRDESWFE